MSAVKAADAAYLYKGRSIRNNTNDRWWNDPAMRGLMWRCVILLSGQYINGYDGAVMNSLLSVPQFIDDMGNPDSNTLGLMTGAISLGYLIALVPASTASDKFGRRWPSMFGCVFVIIGTLVEVFVWNSAWAFFGGRMIVGFGGAFIIIAGSSHVLEVAHPKYATGLSTGFAIIAALGSIVASWVTFGCIYWTTSNWSWRLPAMLQALGAVVSLVAMPFIPESPRWLVSVGRIDEAHELLAKWHANGDMDDELVVIELAEMQEATRISQSASSAYNWIDWVKTKGNRYRLFIVVLVAIMSQWSGSGIISFYASAIYTSIGITGAAEKQAITGGNAIVIFIYCIPLSIYMKHFPRRMVWLGSCIGCIVCYTIITACSATYTVTGNSNAGKAVIAFIYLFQLAYYTGFLGLYYSYMASLLPTSMRTQGVSISLVIGYAMAFFNQYCNPIAFDAIGWKYYLVYLALLLVYLVTMYLTFPEIKHLTAEEASVLLDGVEATAAVKGAGDLKAAKRLGVAVEGAEKGKDGETNAVVMV